MRVDRNIFVASVVLVSLIVFFLLPIVPRQVSVQCQGSTTTYIEATGWQSPSYVLFGIGVAVPPMVACIV